jgi:hypothetical protein
MKNVSLKPMVNLHIHCPVINQEKIHYYLGIVTDQANYMTDWRYNIRVKNGADLIRFCNPNNIYSILHKKDSNYSTLTLYCPDQNFENKSNQDSVSFLVFLKYSVYILLQALTYPYHKFI